MEGLEAALGAALALNPESAKRLGEALQAHRTKMLQVEHLSDQPSRARSNDHGIGSRQIPEAGREVGVAEELLSPRQK